jgi:hypothetical protein
MEVNAGSGSDPLGLTSIGAASSDQRILLRGDFLLPPEGSPLHLVKFFLKGHAAVARPRREA